MKITMMIKNAIKKSNPGLFCSFVELDLHNLNILWL